MPPSYTYRKQRRDGQLRRMAAMRAAKERKRMSEVANAECVGTVTFDGPMFGGRHVLRCLYSDDYSERHLMIEIDGKASKARTVRGVTKLIGRRVAQPVRKENEHE